MRNISTLLGLALMAATSTAGAQSAPATARISVSPTSRLWIEGTSNVHDWKCEARTIDASIDIDALAAPLATAAPKMLRRVEVKVPVKAMKCGHDKMDDNMYKALKADRSAEITYIMGTFEAADAGNSDFTLHTVGTLTIAGSEQPVTMDVIAVRLPDGTIKATGTVPIKMTTFGVEPPRALLGAIRAGDEVKVKFEVTVGPKVIAQAITP